MNQAFLSKSPIGIFALTAEGDIIFYRLFDKNPGKALLQFREDIPASFLAELKGYERADGSRVMRKKIRSFATDLGFAKSSKDFTAFLSEFAALLSKEKMKTAASRDRLIIQASNALEDLMKIQNLLLERIREWYGLHYPELKLSGKELADKIAKYGSRESFPDFSDSSGVPLGDDDENILKSYAETVLHVASQRRELEQYVKSAMHDISPNFSAIVDELLAARLLASAGSLEKMARMSASTIQLMGAEKALFRHLRGGGKSPKFGMIFLSSYVQNASEEQRGKVARVLASKIMQAVRIDFYSGRDESQRLKQELAEEIKGVSR
ncbi:MAG: rRNA biogenesis protein [Candidatus Aenigmarchaeota archaeon]|nr:rRNA biogenesis protein [Candidatus Aenigmarchaeota archaeon]